MRKITKTRLRQIIKEELKLILEFERYVYRRAETAARGAGEIWIKDDDGNDEAAPHLKDEYEHLEAGKRGETIFGTDDLGRYQDDRDDRDDRDDWDDPWYRRR
jgi:hypothetical protein|tara:strand:+ start:1110 stop:1418 length:309 start_codon:yes stop_codon:yes gene_type:complete